MGSLERYEGDIEFVKSDELVFSGTDNGSLIAEGSAA
jgi:hypothetical protein